MKAQSMMVVPKNGDVYFSVVYDGVAEYVWNDSVEDVKEWMNGNCYDDYEVAYRQFQSRRNAYETAVAKQDND